MLSWVVVDTRAWDHNIRIVRKKIGKEILLMPVIKSNAYGHGLVQAGLFCDTHPAVNAICVVDLQEALILRREGVRKPILVLSIYPESDFPLIKMGIEQSIIFPAYSLTQAASLNAYAKRLKRKVSVHCKIDTGTSRIGFLATEAVKDVQKMCSSLKNISFDGIYTHLASSESDAAFTAKQRNAFEDVVRTLSIQGINFPTQHIACSAATFTDTKNLFSAVRIGIHFYGLHSIYQQGSRPLLKPALSWYTTIIQVKTVPKNTSVSYGRTFTTKRTTKIAVLPVGYYDGYDRRFSNNAYVIVRGKRCPVIGRVCMNLTMVDVTDLPRVAAGDTVVLLGRSGKTAVTADELAQRAKTINYEIVTRIPSHIPRIYR